MLPIRQKIFLNSFIVTAILAGLVFVAVLPLKKIIAEQSDLFKEERSTLYFLTQKQDYMEKLKIKYQEMEPNLNLLDKYFLKSDEFVKFVIQMENAAQTTQNNLDVKITSQKEEDIALQISLAGPLPNIIRFVVLLENTAPLVNMESFNIQRVSGEGLAGAKGAKIGDVETLLNIKFAKKDDNK